VNREKLIPEIPLGFRGGVVGYGSVVSEWPRSKCTGRCRRGG
jgi:hypothetical protein